MSHPTQHLSSPCTKKVSCFLTGMGVPENISWSLSETKLFKCSNSITDVEWTGHDQCANRGTSQIFANTDIQATITGTGKDSVASNVHYCTGEKWRYDNHIRFGRAIRPSGSSMAPGSPP